MDRVRIMKTIILILLILLYCGFTCWSMYYISYNIIELRHIMLMNHVPMLILLSSVFGLRNFTKSSYLEKQLYMIADLMVISFLILYCLNYAGFCAGVTKKLLLFNGLNIAFISIVLISCFRHGIFSKN